jgi:crotonobetainyl-CoA:carnitine CoA-transferase CaiB-like acyl-CoA transferase
MNLKPFESLKVVELAGVLAGPSVGMFFAELGAKVLKIENKKTGGDVTRSWKLPAEDEASHISAYFASINFQKRYFLADYYDETELAHVIDLIRDADIVITNFKKGDGEKFGLDYQSIKKINSKLIYGEISGFGEQSDRVAYDLILQAESGFMSMNGTETSGPIKMPVALIDILAGHQLKEGMLVALLERQKTNKGCKVHVSLLDSAIASLANQASNWLMTGHIPQPIGSKHPNIAPYGELFKTSDNRLITLAIGSDAQFQKLVPLLDLEYLAANTDFESNQQRVKNRTQLEKILAEKIVLFKSSDLLQKMHELFIPAALVKTVNEVFEEDSAKKLIREETIDDVPTKRVTGTVFKITD